MYVIKQIAVILPDTLQSVGLQHLLSEYFPPIEIGAFPSFETFSKGKNYDSFDYYFTNTETWILNMDFFLPRKTKTMLILDHKTTSDKSASINYITTNSPLEILIEQFEKLFENETNISHPGEASKGLSLREIDVLQLIVKGITNKEIADKLNISLNTVLTHRKNITSKLGIKTVSGLTFYAIMNGFVSGEEFEL